MGVFLLCCIFSLAKTRDSNQEINIKLVGAGELESPTPSLSVTCSNQLSYMPVTILNSSKKANIFQGKKKPS